VLLCVLSTVHACLGRQPLVVRQLLSANAQLHQRSATGATALQLLREMSRHEVLDALEFTLLLDCTRAFTERVQRDELEHLEKVDDASMSRPRSLATTYSLPACTLRARMRPARSLPARRYPRLRCSARVRGVRCAPQQLVPPPETNTTAEDDRQLELWQLRVLRERERMETLSAENAKRAHVRSRTTRPSPFMPSPRIQATLRVCANALTATTTDA
jgi:hypothetical protein